ncbi:MAG: hypothetical protein Q8N43_03160 [Candidatus Azambacteria bacterium]|nr:hypothetical protein [Candidatus Azambacteria bacterium]
MKKIIQNLQNKPETVKKSIMWIGILFIMTAIFTFWLLTFPSQIPKTKDNEATANLKKELPSVWQTLKSQINTLQNLWQK